MEIIKRKGSEEFSLFYFLKQYMVEL